MSPVRGKKPLETSFVRAAFHSPPYVALGAALLLASTATATTVEGEYLNLSFTGDGATPSSLELFDAQERALQQMRGGGNVGDQGDFTWSIPVDLPPALLSPDLGLDYSSAAGSHSPVARGWTVRSGMTITRVVGLERDRAYAGLGAVFRVNGGGLSGLIFEDDGQWTYAANGLLAVAVESVGDEWVITTGGVTTWLSPADGVPHTWHVRRVRDASGNRVDYEWGVEPAASPSQLVAVEFGGAGPASGSLSSPHLVRVELKYESHPHRSDRYVEGALDRITDRVAEIQVWTDPSGTGTFPHFAGGLELFYEEVDHEELLTEVRQLGTTGASRDVATFEYATYADQLAEGSREGDAPPILSLDHTRVFAANNPSPSSVIDRLYDLTGDGLSEPLTGTQQAAWTTAGTLDWASEYEWVPDDLGGQPPEQSVSIRCGDLYSVSYTTRRIVDLNSDGFPDVVESGGALPVPWTSGTDSCFLRRYDQGHSTTWTLRFGDRTGLGTGFPVEAPAIWPGVGQSLISKKVDADTIGDNTWQTVEGQVVDLLDVDGDGQLDIVRVVPTSSETFSLVVHYANDLSDGTTDAWEPVGVDVLGSGHPLSPDLRSLQRSSQKLELKYSGSAVMEWEQKFPAVAKVHVLTGLNDLNGDGIPDYVDADAAGCPPLIDPPERRWEVHLGTGSRATGEGFAPPVCWSAPLEGVGLALSDEGRARSIVCQTDTPQVAAAVAEDPWAAWQCGHAVLDEESPFGGGPGYCPLPTFNDLTCSHVGDPVLSYEDTGRYRVQTLGLLDMDGDGRQDLVDAGYGWWRNLGDRFAAEAHDLPTGFTVDGFADALHVPDDHPGFGGPRAPARHATATGGRDHRLSVVVGPLGHLVDHRRRPRRSARLRAVR